LVAGCTDLRYWQLFEPGGVMREQSAGAIVESAASDVGPASDPWRFLLVPAAFASLPALLLAAFIAVDPFYVFGSPGWSGFNAVRPYYERHVVVAKPYRAHAELVSEIVTAAGKSNRQNRQSEVACW
jgi:hypothetical protein